MFTYNTADKTILFTLEDKLSKEPIKTKNHNMLPWPTSQAQHIYSKLHVDKGMAG